LTHAAEVLLNDALPFAALALFFGCTLLLNLCGTRGFLRGFFNLFRVVNLIDQIASLPVVAIELRFAQVLPCAAEPDARCENLVARTTEVLFIQQLLRTRVGILELSNRLLAHEFLLLIDILQTAANIKLCAGCLQAVHCRGVVRINLQRGAVRVGCLSPSARFHVGSGLVQQFLQAILILPGADC